MSISRVAAARQAVAAKDVQWLLNRDRKIAERFAERQAEQLIRSACCRKPQPRDCSLIDIRDNMPVEAETLPYRAPAADLGRPCRRVINRVFAGCKA